MKAYAPVIIIICSLYVDSVYSAMSASNENLPMDLKEHELTYSEDDLRKIFNDLKDRSFAELSKSTNLVFKEKKNLGYASPFTFNLYIDIDRINKYRWPEDAVIGLFAHELAHIVSYRRRSFLRRILFIWDYYISDDTRRKVEHEADTIAIEKGYGNQLVLTRTLAIRDYDRERVEKMKKVYYSPEDLKKLISNKE